MAAITPEERLAQLTDQMTQVLAEQARIMRENSLLQAQVQTQSETLRAFTAFGPPAAAAQQAEGAAFDARTQPTVFGPGGSFGIIGAKAPQFHFGKQCCPEVFTGIGKDGLNDYAFKMANFLAMSTVNYRHVGAVLEWAAKAEAPITQQEYTREAGIEDWDGASNVTISTLVPVCGLYSPTRRMVTP